MWKQTARLAAIGLIGAMIIAPLTASATARKGAAPRAVVIPNVGPKGYVEKTSAFTATAGQDTAGIVQCPSGKVVLGGGVYSSGGLTVSVNSDVPTKNNKGWRASVANTGVSDSNETVYAFCGNKPTAYKVVRTKGDNPAGAQSSVSAPCPTGSKVLGGGGSSLQAGPQYFALNSTLPNGNAWRADMDNASPSTDNTVTAVAVCGKGVKGYVVTEGSPSTNTAGEQNFTSVDCPGSKVPLSGGVYSSSGSTLVSINATSPTSTGWFAYENNNSGSDSAITAWVVCAK